MNILIQFISIHPSIPSARLGESTQFNSLQYPVIIIASSVVANALWYPLLGPSLCITINGERIRSIICHRRVFCVRRRESPNQSRNLVLLSCSGPDIDQLMLLQTLSVHFLYHQNVCISLSCQCMFDCQYCSALVVLIKLDRMERKTKTRARAE